MALTHFDPKTVITMEFWQLLKWCSFNFNCASKQGNLWPKWPWILSNSVDLSA